MSGITNHGERRMRKRLGINKKSAEALFERALKEGKRPAEFKGKFRHYLDFWCRDYRSRAIVYNNAIYFVDNSDTLITVWPVPSKFNKYL